MQSLSAAWRFFRVAAHLLAGVWIVWWRFPRLNPAQREAEVQNWSKELLVRLAIKLVVTGMPPAAGPVLLASNHISWLDIVVMHAARHCRFVSKAEVRHWPIVGMLATAAGTLYIERESRRDAMRVVHHMAERLQAGDILAVFPEGTTGDGTHLLPFHANLLQAAIAARAPIQPVALTFIDEASGAQSFAPCYVGDDTLLASLWRTLRAQGLVAVVRYGESQTAQGRDRRAWASDLRAKIEGMRTSG